MQNTTNSAAIAVTRRDGQKMWKRTFTGPKGGKVTMWCPRSAETEPSQWAIWCYRASDVHDGMVAGCASGI